MHYVVKHVELSLFCYRRLHEGGNPVPKHLGVLVFAMNCILLGAFFGWYMDWCLHKFGLSDEPTFMGTNNVKNGIVYTVKLGFYVIWIIVSLYSMNMFWSVIPQLQYKQCCIFCEYIFMLLVQFFDFTFKLSINWRVVLV